MLLTLGLAAAAVAIGFILLARGVFVPGLRTTGKCFREVVGESHYQPALQRICGGRAQGGLGLQKTALLVPEDRNPHDANAIRVLIHLRTVGYLPAGQARLYRDRLQRAGLPLRIYKAPAAIRGGGRLAYGVWLDLPDRLGGDA